MRFRYKKIAVTVSLIVMGIGMITWTTRLATMDESTKVEKDSEENEEKPGEEGDSETKLPDIDGTTSSAVGGNENEEGAVETITKENGLEKNAYPEINELITAYLNAKLAGDEKKLADLVDDVSYLDMNDVKRRTERIEEYQTIDCYTLAGPEEGSFMVYVYSEVKVKEIDTLVSGLDGFYIRTNDAGKMMITMGEVSEEVEAQLTADREREDVAKLIQDVNRKFAEEVKNDGQLAEYYEELQKADESQ